MLCSTILVIFGLVILNDEEGYVQLFFTGLGVLIRLDVLEDLLSENCILLDITPFIPNHIQSNTILG